MWFLLDFNQGSSRTPDDDRSPPIADRINQLLDAVLIKENELQPKRPYVGASSIGDACERKIQLQYIKECELEGAPVPEPFPPRILRIFRFGHLFEDMIADLIIKAGFDMTVKRKDGRQYGFSVLGNRCRGHVDGIIHGGPLPLQYPLIWECKSLNNKSWNETVKKGLKLSKPIYAAQIAIDQAYLELTNPCLFTAINKDTAEFHHSLVEFDSKLAQDSSDKAVRIIKATENGRLLPRSFSGPDHFQCKFCRFSDACWYKLPDS